MAKIDTDNMFKKMIGQGQDQGEVKIPKESKKTAPVKNDDEELIQKAYYITKKQYKQLKMAAATGDDNISAIVRTALDDYFSKQI